MNAYWSVLVAGAYSGADAASLDGDPSRRHAPQDRSLLRSAALELRSLGLTLTDIGDALRLSAGAVRELLENHA